MTKMRKAIGKALKEEECIKEEEHRIDGLTTVDVDGMMLNRNLR